MFKTLGWRAPSNIALVKYWGKKEGQIPCNPSLSVTLSDCWSETKLEYQKGNFKVDYYFLEKEIFSQNLKLKNFIQQATNCYPELLNYRFVFHSANNFPQGTGMASSASSYASIALCLLSLLKNEGHFTGETSLFLDQASFLARLGSGSASRSLWGGFVSWGDQDLEKGAPNLDIHPIFQTMKHACIIVSEEEKKVSSTQGHHLMNDHLFARERYRQAQENFQKLTLILKEGGWSDFQKIVFQEAMTLHALMMSASSPFILMEPLTLELLKVTRKSAFDFAITLDAGANLHLFYPKSQEKDATIWLQKISRSYSRQVLYNHVGSGPHEIFSR